MTRAILTALATACIFALGVATGMWVQKTEPVPPPPIGVMGEIRDIPLSATAPAPANEATPSLRAEIERMKPDIEAFKQKLHPIKQEFRAGLELMLSPEQCEKLKALSERHARQAAPSSSATPSRTHKDGLESLVPIVIVPLTLDKLTDALQLTEAQRADVHQLLLKRREQFLQLVDSNPPPSLQLGKMAPTTTSADASEKR